MLQRLITGVVQSFHNLGQWAQSRVTQLQSWKTLVQHSLVVSLLKFKSVLGLEGMLGLRNDQIVQDSQLLHRYCVPFKTSLRFRLQNCCCTFVPWRVLWFVSLEESYNRFQKQPPRKLTVIHQSISKKPFSEGCQHDIGYSGYKHTSCFYLFIFTTTVGDMVVKWVASQLQGPRFSPELGLLYYMFPLCPCEIPLGSPVFSNLLKTRW